jgi:hypothetical protein
VAQDGWLLSGNQQTDPDTDFLGTTDAQPFVIKTNGAEAVRVATDTRVGIGTPNPAGQLHVAASRRFESPQVVIEQPTPDDFARLRFNSTVLSTGDPDNPHPPRPTPAPLWDIAVGGRGTNIMNFFQQFAGNIVTLSAFGGGAVGVRVENPTAPLHVNGTARVGILEITGGSDLAESFPVEPALEAEPGTVVVIDDRHPGTLKVSDTAYDRRVAGVISGAGGINPGVTLTSSEPPNGKSLVTLAGCVWCKAAATYEPIAPGDRLTTAPVAGHAMKATDDQAASGAIIGKAMSPLPGGQGLVMVLVNLQ